MRLHLTNARWLAITFGLLLIALASGVGITLWGVSVARSPTFLQQVMTPYVQVQEYSLRLDHADCDIVIYGDSSAMTAADPSTIEAMTHLKTCNIAQVQSIVAVFGVLPVDLYLRRNHPPRYLVIQLAPETLFRTHLLNKIHPLDPLTYLLRHDRGIDSDAWMLRYPQTTPAICERCPAGPLQTEPRGPRQLSCDVQSADRRILRIARPPHSPRPCRDRLWPRETSG